MAAPYSRRQPASHGTGSDSDSQRSYHSYSSHSTAPTSVSESPRPSGLKQYAPSSITTTTTTTTTTTASSARYASRHDDYRSKARYVYDSRDDVSPSTWISPRSTDDFTCASTTLSCDDLDLDETPDYDGGDIPPLPEYCHGMVEPNVRISTPQDFAKLFPSLNRLTVRHDEFTNDGNMNLRIDSVVTTTRRRTAVQLFHLRMYDLARRDFVLRRYHRDSGREVCTSKLQFLEPPATKERPASAGAPLDALKPAFKRSVSSALWSLGSGKKPVLQRAASDHHHHQQGPRPSTSASNWSSRLSLDSRLLRGGAAAPRRPVPTHTLKLEFSNYARVELTRKGSKSSKRYEFEWWGHSYAWRRAVDKHIGAVSFHLVRDGDASAPVAHIVPETRSPTQVLADETAGGWVPPCFMWIADESAVKAVTDVADVIMATGLMALVDDCIRERWEKPAAAARKAAAHHHSLPAVLPFLSSSFDGAAGTSTNTSASPKAFLMHHLFRRRRRRRGSDSSSDSSSIGDPNSRPGTPTLARSPLRVGFVNPGLTARSHTA
ncbi:hypothetical protein VTJ83DRAFT_4297 [Remersonia thermophila]|uniref:Uncharacterized protein n=1 Tax=Remersonia thermophila TaxID=72144 RepID=A0ABR4D9M0_9PEZI